MSLHPETRQPPSTLASVNESSVDDWTLLFDAVTTRLRRYVVEAPATRVAAPKAPLALPVHEGVLDCIDALGQLRVVAAQALERARQRERDLHEAQDSVARLEAKVEDRRIGERQMRSLALHDDLTTLPHRVLFRDRLEQASQRADPARPGLAVLVLDLDEFRRINDQQGHGAGDHVLRIVAARLTGALRTGDLVGRCGGDEFACQLLGTMGCEQLGHLARRLLDAVGEPVQIGDLQFRVQPSIGVAVYPADGTGADDLLAHAYAAMDRAKRQRNGYSFYDVQLDA